MSRPRPVEKDFAVAGLRATYREWGCGGALGHHVDFVLTLKIFEDWYDQDLERATMLVRSISHFWRGKKRFDLKVVAPHEDLKIVSRELRSTTRVEITLIDEEDLVYALAQPNTFTGNQKQQVLKLAYAAVCASPFYLVLNSDLICVRDFNSETLVVDGKALTDWEPRSHHPEWWATSAEVLGVPPPRGRRHGRDSRHLRSRRREGHV